MLGGEEPLRDNILSKKEGEFGEMLQRLMPQTKW